MTRIGYEDIINRIVNRPVVVPDDLSLKELQGWMNGYEQSQKDIIKIIEDLKGERQ